MVDTFPFKLSVPFIHSSSLPFIAALPFPVAAGVYIVHCAKIGEKPFLLGEQQNLEAFFLSCGGSTQAFTSLSFPGM